MHCFWHQLIKPIIGQAPMDGVSDAPFRYITAKYGKPDVTFTEFTHVQGLWCGDLEVYKDFLYDDIERPIVAQIFGADPEYFYKAAHICCALGFDGIDINMGCPANSVIKKGGGASLIKDPQRAKNIIRKTQQGVKDWAEGHTLEQLGLTTDKINYIEQVKAQTHHLSTDHHLLPVSVKTRIGFEKVVIKEWVNHLLEAQPVVISMHGRTLKQGYHGQANWEAMGSVSDLIHQAGVLYLGNGDIQTRDQALQCLQTYGMDGALVGRASFGNPWVFSKQVPSCTPNDKLQVALEHARLHETLKGPRRFHEIRKHLGWYCKDFAHAKELRVQLVKAPNVSQVEKVISQFLQTLPLDPGASLQQPGNSSKLG